MDTINAKIAKLHEKRDKLAKDKTLKFKKLKPPAAYKPSTTTLITEEKNE